ncbi:MAG: DUF1636 domain-containing protein [Pseudomonadota bacterium]
MAEDVRNLPRAAPAPVPDTAGNTEPNHTKPNAVLSICLRCRDGRENDYDGVRGGARLAEAVLQAGAASSGLAVRGVHCLSQCKRAAVIAVSGDNRFTYFFGDLDPARDASAVIALAKLYADSPDGFLERNARPKPMQAGVLGRLPPLGWRGGAVETVDLTPHLALENPR